MISLSSRSIAVSVRLFTRTLRLQHASRRTIPPAGPSPAIAVGKRLAALAGWACGLATPVRQRGAQNALPLRPPDETWSPPRGSPGGAAAAAGGLPRESPSGLPGPAG